MIKVEPLVIHNLGDEQSMHIVTRIMKNCKFSSPCVVDDVQRLHALSILEHGEPIQLIDVGYPLSSYFFFFFSYCSL